MSLKIGPNRIFEKEQWVVFRERGRPTGEGEGIFCLKHYLCSSDYRALFLSAQEAFICFVANLVHKKPEYSKGKDGHNHSRASLLWDLILIRKTSPPHKGKSRSWLLKGEKQQKKQLTQRQIYQSNRLAIHNVPIRLGKHYICLFGLRYQSSRL